MQIIRNYSFTSYYRILKNKNYTNIIEGIEDFFYRKSGKSDFQELAIDVFNYQFEHNPLYRAFASRFINNPKEVSSLVDIPFLPISLFKNHKVYCSSNEPEIIFFSSGTTSGQTSKHYISSLDLYEKSFVNCFSKFYGKLESYNILALLPGYLERPGSSLVYMVKKLSELSNSAISGFYINQYDKLTDAIIKSRNSSAKTLLIGVTHALLDYADYCGCIDFSDIIVMETGGMKGHGRELIREELHNTLKSAFSVEYIHSEYGMTELLSQAYSKGDGLFRCPEWMKVIGREMSDPLTITEYGKNAGLNIIDLANVFSCSFIATDDMGVVYEDGGFTIGGRFEQSDLRGCNLLI